MPKMNKGFVQFRPMKIDYYPNKYEYKENQQLIVILHGIAQDGKSYSINLYDTYPRFWTEVHPDNVDMDKEDRKLITNVVRHGKNGDGKQLYEIQFKYPFHTEKLRRYFKPHYQADIPYVDTIRLFYKIKNIILIPKDVLKTKKLYPDQIKQYFGDDKLPLNAYILDIETDDKRGFAEGKNPTAIVPCVTFQRVEDGTIEHATILDVDKEKIEKMLGDSKWLLENTSHEYGNDTIPYSINDLNIKIYKLRDEYQLFHWINSFIKNNNVSIIDGHNVGYDVGYIEGRCKWKNKLISKSTKTGWYPKISFRKFQIFDNMKAYAELHSGEVSVTGRVALDWMSKKLLGYGKVKRPKICEMMEKDPNRLSVYNIWDCELVLRTDMVTNALNYFFEMSRESGIGLDKCFSTIVPTEFTKMYYIFPNIILPSREFAMKKKPYEGGMVNEPYCGFEKNIIYLDNTKEYPSVVISGNTDNETKCKTLCDSCKFKECNWDVVELDEECKKYEKGNVSTFPSGNMYKLDERGIIPKILLEMTERRDKIISEMKKYDRDSQKYKSLDSQQRVLKFRMNGMYGTFGSGDKKGGEFRSRLADSDIAGDITEVARLHLQWNIDFINKFKLNYNNNITFKVIYGDTDGVKVKINQDVKEWITLEHLNNITNIIVDKLNESFLEFTYKTIGVKEQYFNIKKEDALEWYYQWGAKKRYCEKPFNSKYPKIVGAEMKRRDSSNNAKKVQNKFFYSIGKKSLEEIRKELIEFESEIREGKHNKGCGKTTGIHSEGHHVYKDMVWCNENIGTNHKLGDVVVIYIVKNVIAKELGRIPLPKKKLEEQKRVILAWNDDPDDFEYNGKKYKLSINHKCSIERDIVSPMNHIIKGFGFPTYQAFKSGFKQSNLGGFF